MRQQRTSQSNKQWLPMRLPPIFERMMAFTIPSLESVIVMSYQGLHIIELQSRVSVRTLPQHAEDYRIYSPEAHTLVFNGCIYPTLGLHGGKPILEDTEGRSLSIDAQRQYVLVHHGNEEPQKLPYDDYSGDWVHVTFSRDRNTILIGVPHALYVFRGQSAP